MSLSVLPIGSVAASRRRLLCVAALAAFSALPLQAQSSAASFAPAAGLSPAAIEAVSHSVAASYSSNMFEDAAAQPNDDQQPQAGSAAPGTAPQQQRRPTTAAPGTAPMRSAERAKALAPGTGPTYNERVQIYGGLLFQNGQAGQNLPKRFNMGGGEIQPTYWLGGPRSGSLIGRHLGLTGDYRWSSGTTPVISPFYNRVVIREQDFTGGITWRGPRNRYAAVQYHALAGGTSGIFDHAVQNYPGGSPVSACPAQQRASQQGNLGLYCNGTAFYGEFGASLDFNVTPKWAVRLSPDLVMEKYGTELREFVSVSMGGVYRWGHR